MLYVSLILSAAHLLIVNRIVARSSYPVPWVLAVSLGFFMCPSSLMVFFPSVAAQAVILSGLLLVLLIPDRGRRLYRPLSGLATLAVYGFFVWQAASQHRELVNLRQEYPYESLESRLPDRPVTEPPRLAHPERLQELELQIGRNMRSDALQRVHEHAVDEFVNSAGYGVGRMVRRNPTRTLREALPDRPAVAQPDYLDPFFPPAAGSTATPREWKPQELGRFHDDGTLDFLNPAGFGFAKDRRHVAGFQRHGMSKVPQAATGWAVARIDLIGLIVHEQPLAYVSANLPQMSQLAKVPTRSLDAFERDGLVSLRDGEDLHTQWTVDAGRMVGAIRATSQCLVCHGGSRGDLLGAFSYGLRRNNPKP